MPDPPVITLTSDFGPGPYPGIMKGVILGICPRARLVDLSHAVPPQDVAAGAAVLEAALGVFPPGAVHLAVVDPGVGTARRALALEAAGQLWVGPDNGLFSPALAADPEARAFRISDPSLLRHPVSRTFHGRDVFAPVAAHLAGGLDIARVGPPVADPVRLPEPEVREEGGTLWGRVVSVDAFGNLASSLSRRRVEVFLAGREAVVEAAGLTIRGLSESYASVAGGEAAALFNSLDRLELALNRGDLCRRLGLEPGGARGLEVAVRAEAPQR